MTHCAHAIATQRLHRKLWGVEGIDTEQNGGCRNCADHAFSDHLVVDQQHLSKVCRGGASDPKRCEYFKFGGPPYILQISLTLGKR